MNDFNQRVVAITGAATGIGRALSLAFAKEGAQIAISDINEIKLKETAQLLADMDVKPLVSIVDVSNRDAMRHWAKEVADHFGGVNVIINNAGVVCAHTADNIPYDEFEWLMKINFWGVVHGVNAFLPYISDENQGHIVNVSSVLGVLTTPMMAAYSSSKFAVRGYTDGLRIDLMQSHPHIGVTCIFPSAIETDIMKMGRGKDISIVQSLFNAKSTKKISADRAAQKMLIVIKKNKARALIGPSAWFFDLLHRVAPNRYHGLFIYLTKHILSNEQAIR